MMMLFSTGIDMHMFLSFSEIGDCSLVMGISVTLTFLVTVIFLSLVMVLTAMLVRVHRRKKNSASLGPVCPYETPSSVGREKETIKMSANIVYGRVQPQSTPDDDTYDYVAP